MPKRFHGVILLLTLAMLIPSILFAGGPVHVKGYTRKDGTYVAPHYRSAPDGNFSNNWSTKGNINPYTGKAGTRVTPPSGSSSSWSSPYSSGRIEIGESSEYISSPSSHPNGRIEIRQIGATAAAGQKIEGKVVGISDGGTLTVLAGTTEYTVRLFGIDAPESGQPFATQAKEALFEKVFGKTITVLSQGTDKHGRTLGTVRMDERNVNLELAREGWAWRYSDSVFQVLCRLLWFMRLAAR